MHHAQGLTRFTHHDVEPDIVVVQWEPSIRFTEEDAADILGYMRHLGVDGPRPLLVRPSGMTSICRAALKSFAQPGWVSRIAVTGRSLIDGLLLDLYNELYAPPFEVRHFDDERAALRWLRSPEEPRPSRTRTPAAIAMGTPAGGFGRRTDRFSGR